MQTTKKILFKETKNQNKISSKSVSTGEYKMISLDVLEVSPLNYRKSFLRNEMDELAADVKQHGIISSLVVRRSDSGRFEIVVGERRFHAARIAGLEEVPVSIVTLTDQEVIEIQLSENLQRSDTHPMEEALAIERLQAFIRTLMKSRFEWVSPKHLFIKD